MYMLLGNPEGPDRRPYDMDADPRSADAPMSSSASGRLAVAGSRSDAVIPNG